jgi:hypothetical protein
MDSTSAFDCHIYRRSQRAASPIHYRMDHFPLRPEGWNRSRYLGSRTIRSLRGHSGICSERPRTGWMVGRGVQIQQVVETELDGQTHMEPGHPGPE